MIDKFKAWDDIAKKMYYSETEQFDDMLGFRFKHFETDNPIYMEYSRLKDKNDKEIYEGDIIVIPYITPFGKITNQYNKKYVVKKKHGSFGFETEKEFIPLLNYIEQEKGEYIPNVGNKVIYKNFIGKVIGNIYENSELRKEVV